MEILATRSHDEMKEVLMDPNCIGPSIHYYMIRGGHDKKNITVWQSGLAGKEFIKTYGHYHIIDFKEIYWIIEGEGILLLQARKKNDAGEWINDEIEWFKAVPVKAGDAIAIPSFAGHALVNTGSTWLVTSDDSPVHPGNDSAKMPVHADYTPIRNMHGMAFYVVATEKGPTLLPNPNYKNTSDFEEKDLWGDAKNFAI